MLKTCWMAPGFDCYTARVEDGDHRIGVGEFVEGCIHIRGPAREVDLMRQLRDCMLQKAEPAFGRCNGCQSQGYCTGHQLSF